MLTVNFSQPIRTFNENTVDKKSPNQSKKNAGIVAAAAAGSAIVSAAGVGIMCRGNFNKNIAKLGLELKNGVLMNPKTGEKFTGNIKSYVGRIGFNRIETRSFVDGVITEKTYKNAAGAELDGFFYKDGKECLKVHVGYPYFVPCSKSAAVYRYTQDKTGMEHTDMRGFSGKSVFAWARNFVKEHGWLKK